MKKLVSVALALCLTLVSCVAIAAKKAAPTFPWNSYTVRVLSVFDEAAVAKKFKKDKELLWRVARATGTSRAVKVRLDQEKKLFGEYIVQMLKYRPYCFGLLDGEGNEFSPVAFEFFETFTVNMPQPYGHLSSQDRLTLVFDLPKDVKLADLSLLVREEKDEEGNIVSLKNAPRYDDKLSDDYTKAYGSMPFVTPTD